MSVAADFPDYDFEVIGLRPWDTGVDLYRERRDALLTLREVEKSREGIFQRLQRTVN